MAVIENFSKLTTEELNEFASKLIKTLNTEHTFTDDFDFILDSLNEIEASDFDGNLYIPITHDDMAEVEREAKWTCTDYEDRYSADNPDFDSSVYEDAEKFFKTLSVTLDEYKVTLQIDDVDEGDFEVDDISSCKADDDGIGSYEFWGHRGYDSNPYYAVEGTVTQACTCFMTLVVEPIIK